MAGDGQTELGTLTDEELLERIVEHTGKLLAAAMLQHVEAHGLITDDPRWGFRIPLKFDIQIRYLTASAFDACDVAVAALRRRASQVAFGAMRFQMETIGVLSWLAEPDDARERSKRIYRLTLGVLERTKGLFSKTTPLDGEARAALQLTENMLAKLRQIIREDGFQTVKESPKTDHLINKYVGSHTTFGAFSEVGAHPGVAGHLLFAEQDGDTIQLDLTGALVERAFWIGVSYEFLRLTLSPIGKARDWSHWLDETALPIVMAGLPLLEEIRRRRVLKRS